MPAAAFFFRSDRSIGDHFAIGTLFEQSPDPFLRNGTLKDKSARLNSRHCAHPRRSVRCGRTPLRSDEGAMSVKPATFARYSRRGREITKVEMAPVVLDPRTLQMLGSLRRPRGFFFSFWR